MWPIPRITDESIACIFTPQHISLSLLIPKKDGILLKAYTRVSLLCAELEYSIICNPTYIKKVITSFVHSTKAYYASTHFAICGPIINEKITNKATTIASALYASYLYQHDAKKFYYTASISQASIMQYQLIALSTGLHLCTITTPFIAQLKVYHTVYGSSFAHTQLAHDLRMHNHRIENIFNDETILYNVEIANNVNFDLASERSFLLSSLGLFYLRSQQ